MKKHIPLIISIFSIIIALICAAVSLKYHDLSFLSVIAAALLCAPFFIGYEKSEKNSRITVIVAVMTALAVVGRFAFAQIPGFKPVTAVVIITGIYLGRQAGFMTGALAALISNIYFGQGPWTPFEMLAWGITGFGAGLLNISGLLEKKIPLLIYGAFAGLIYSLIMDIFTVISFTGSFSAEKYITTVIASAYFTGEYAFSNIVFLLLIMVPAEKIMKRLQKKYGLKPL